jgi:hypothetical protein
METVQQPLLTLITINCTDNSIQSHPYAGIVILGEFNTLRDKPKQDYPHKNCCYCTYTRGQSALDKIFTIVSVWYKSAVVLSAIS